MAVLPKQTVVVTLKGMNQKIAGTISAPGTLEMAENLMARRGDGSGAFEFIRRNGMTQLVDSAVAAVRLGTVADGIVIRSTRGLWSYSSILGAVREWSSPLQPTEVDRFDIHTPTANGTGATSPAATSLDVAFYQNIGIWIWINDLGGVQCVVRDTTADVVLGFMTLVSSGATHARCVMMGGKFYIFWNEAASSNRIRAMTVDPLTQALGTITTVIAAPLAASDYDIMAGFDATHIALLYRKTAGTYTRVLLDSAYTQTQSTDDATAANQPTQGMCWFHAQDSYASGSIWYATINTVNFAKVQKISLTTLASQSTFSDASADIATSVNWTGYVSGTGTVGCLLSEVPGTPVYKTYIRNSMSGVTNIVNYAGLASRAFYLNAQAHVLCLYNSASAAVAPQDTYFLCVDGVNIGATGMFINGQALRSNSGRLENGHVSSAAVDSSGAWHTAARFVMSVESTAGKLVTQYGVTDLSWQLCSYRTGQPVEFGSLTWIPGAQPRVVDGARGLTGDVVEPGFVVAPEPLVLVEGAAASGSIPPGTRSFVARFKWIDRTGQFSYSAPSSPVAITTVNVNSSVQATAWPYIGTRQNVQIEIFRTPNNGTGDQYFRSTPPTYAGATGTLQTFVDTASEVTLAAGEELIPSGAAGGEVENTGLPAVTALCEHKNRLAGILSEQPWRIQISKERVDGRSLEWFDGFIVNTPQNTGPIYALASFDGHLLAIKRNTVYAIDGDFPDANSGGPQIPLPYLIPTGVGTIDPRSVVVTGLGVMFHDRSKGFWLINRSLQAVYIGAQVEATANTGSVVISGAAVTGNGTQVRWTSEGGTSFCLDTYFLEQGTPVWTTFTGQPAVHSINHLGRWYHLTTDGKLKVENAIWCDGSQPGEQGSFTPGTEYFGKLTISDINFAGILGFLRCWRAQILGQWFAGHKLRMTVYDNHRDTAGDVYDFDATSNPDPYMMEARIRRQKVTSKRITVEEVTAGYQQTQGAAWTALAFSVGVKPGLSRLPQTKTMVGS